MADDQLPLFQRKTFKGIIPFLPIEIQQPTREMTVISILPAYYMYLKGEDLSKYTPDDFTGDVKNLGCFCRTGRLKMLPNGTSRRGFHF